MGLFSKFLKLVQLNVPVRQKTSTKHVRITNSENNETKNPDVIETFRDYYCNLVAEEGFFKGGTYHPMISKL